MKKLVIKVDEMGEGLSRNKELEIKGIFNKIESSHDLVRAKHVGSYREHIIEKVENQRTMLQQVSDAEFNKIISELKKIEANIAKTAKALSAEFDKIEKLGN